MEKPITSSENPKLQSPWLYIEAVGSNQSDGSVPGIHLRWDLTRSLGETHIPQGGEGQGDDYVEIYRAQYEKQFPCIIDFQTPPDFISEQGISRYWRYNDFIPVPSVPQNRTHIVIRFKDIDHYDEVRSQFDPNTNPSAFFNHYKELIEIQAVGKLMFEVSFIGIAERFQIEAISLPPDQDAEGKHISCRGAHETEKPNWSGVLEEHIRYIRFKRGQSVIKAIKVVTYHDTMLGYDDLFKYVDRFGLTTDSELAITRLMPDAIHGKWQKYNDGVTVNAQNYLDRWEPSDLAVIGEGIRTGGEKYLNLSAADPMATEIQTDGDGISQSVSYLNLLKFVSIDYHVARMLGLGHIDQPEIQADKKIIYLAKYKTSSDPANPDSGEKATHFSLTLPTNRLDHRLPPFPKITDLKYGLLWYGGEPVFSSLSDENGYDYFNKVRYVSFFTASLPFGKSATRKTNWSTCLPSRPIRRSSA